MNPMQMIQLMRSGGNPHAMINMLRQQAGNNPIINNALGMMEQGNTAGVEDMVKNICKGKGLDPNQVMQETRKMFGM